jgi:uncharacterized protein
VSSEDGVQVIPRDLERELRRRATSYPVVVVTGPRQSGKTTLCRATFPKLKYASLELPDTRRRAVEDPRGFLAEHAAGAVLDEIQHVPDLLSYIQEDVDTRPGRGRFVLTGSQHFGLRQAVTQSLAGRAGILELLPFSWGELRRSPFAPASLFEAMHRGGYPPIYDRDLSAGEWHDNYVATYVERDVRQLLNIGDLLAFQTFLRLCAARTGQLTNLSDLGSDAGVTHNTARSWLGVLEASYLCHRVPPYHRNVGKRLVKAPKLHFLDTGLACYLLGIRTPDELRHHPLRGAVFESWVMSEIVKVYRNRGTTPDLSFLRDTHGLEADGVLRSGLDTIALEAKSGQTLSSDVFDTLDRVAALLADPKGAGGVDKVVVYGGDERLRHRETTTLPWHHVDQHAWGLPAARPRRSRKR